MRPLPIIFSLLALCACSRGEFIGAQGAGTTTADTVTVPAGTNIGKLKARTVIIQQGHGNMATPTDNSRAGQRNGSAATAPGAVASTTTEQAGLPWWVFALVGVLSIAAWEWATQQFKLAAWLPWRVKPR